MTQITGSGADTLLEPATVATRHISSEVLRHGQARARSIVTRLAPTRDQLKIGTGRSRGDGGQSSLAAERVVLIAGRGRVLTLTRVRPS